MRISTRGRYGLRAMLDLANESKGKPVSILSISERQGISDKYLEQIFPSLKNAGLVRSVRGPKGGYVLARDPGEITVGQILRILEGSLAPVECVDDDLIDDCKRRSYCPTRFVWEIIKGKIENAVDSVTLKDLLNKKRE